MRRNGLGVRLLNCDLNASPGGARVATELAGVLLSYQRIDPFVKLGRGVEPGQAISFPWRHLKRCKGRSFAAAARIAEQPSASKVLERAIVVPAEEQLPRLLQLPL